MPRLQPLLNLLLAASGLAMVACAGPPATTPAATVGADSSARPPLVAATPAAPARVADPPAGATAQAVAVQASRFEVVPTGTRAGFRVREQLARVSLPSDAVGTTSSVSGGITLGPDGQVIADQSKFVVDLASLQTDESRRDQFIKRNTLETSRYPTAEFVPTATQGLPFPLPASGQQSFQVIGNLTIHGVTRPATWDVTGQFAGDEITGQATTAFTFEDFGMSPPSAAVVLSVEDNVKLEIDFHLARKQ